MHQGAGGEGMGWGFGLVVQLLSPSVRLHLDLFSSLVSSAEAKAIFGNAILYPCIHHEMLHCCTLGGEPAYGCSRYGQSPSLLTHTGAFIYA